MNHLFYLLAISAYFLLVSCHHQQAELSPDKKTCEVIIYGIDNQGRPIGEVVIYEVKKEEDCSTLQHAK